MDLEKILSQFDEYSRNARIKPALLCFLPVVVTLSVWANMALNAAEALLATAAGVGLFFFLANLARHMGKRAEAKLISTWGGWPSTLFLRHGNTAIDLYTKARYIKRIQALMHADGASWSPPSELDEASDPLDADSRYRAAGTWLIANSRDQKRFNLLFKENVNYGFRRNLYGLKIVGIGICIVCLAINLLALFLVRGTDDSTIWLTGIGSASFSGLTLMGWLFTVTPAFVRDVANAYAFQLLSVADQLSPHEISRATTSTRANPSDKLDTE